MVPTFSVLYLRSGALTIGGSGEALLRDAAQCFFTASRKGRHPAVCSDLSYPQQGSGNGVPLHATTNFNKVKFLCAELRTVSSEYIAPALPCFLRFGRGAVSAFP